LKDNEILKKNQFHKLLQIKKLVLKRTKIKSEKKKLRAISRFCMIGRENKIKDKRIK
jgi:hypothetical protein